MYFHLSCGVTQLYIKVRIKELENLLLPAEVNLILFTTHFNLSLLTDSSIEPASQSQCYYF